MELLNSLKKQIRSEIKFKKKTLSHYEMQTLSAEIEKKLKSLSLFRDASVVVLYHALPGEVQTADLIESCFSSKKILLPVVDGNDLLLVPYKGKVFLKEGAFGILEPLNLDEAVYVDKANIDLIVVPGVAFDVKCNRLGRGCGFYDRLLKTINCPKVGLCYDFQLYDEIPMIEGEDEPMDLVITETAVYTSQRF